MIILYRLFIQEPDSRNAVVVEKFNVNFKCNRFSIDEGKEKILKKAKDCLEKQKIAYSDSVLEEIFIPKGILQLIIIFFMIKL